MGIGNVLNIGRSGMIASKAAIATSGHNITNSKTEGFSRQRVQTETNRPDTGVGSRAQIGRGTLVGRVERLNDAYLEKQLRTSEKEMAHLEEKDFLLQHVENLFNEMDGEGLNRLISRFFNEFRRLANEPDRQALKEAVRESSSALVKDIHRLRTAVQEASNLVDSRIEGATGDLNSLTRQMRDLNNKIRAREAGGAVANDLRDQRDVLLKHISEYLDVSMNENETGEYQINIKGLGPLVVGPNAEQFTVQRSPRDDQGKPEGALDLMTTAYAGNVVTHQVKGGKLGALLDVRDTQISQLMDKLDDIAFTVSTAVNQIHRQGVNRFGNKGINFFVPITTKERAAHTFDLSQEVKSSLDNIVSAAQPNAPGDNRIALAIAGLQGSRLMNDGTTTMDDYYNAMVSEVGVVRARNRESLAQQTNVNRQLGKMREQLSGVSIDEETANLLQFQHIFDASARVISTANRMLDTVLAIKD